MQTFTNKSLKPYNTFGIDVIAKKFISVETVEEIKTILKRTYAAELFILGGGSNMLLTQDIEKTVVHINLKGKRLIKETKAAVFVEAMAGENWHQFVLWCIENGYGGLENLSLIPGNVGTAPIQNIGAYGVELKDTFYSCKALNIQTLQEKEFTLEECEFGYRDSIFKSGAKDRFIIASVSFKLTKENHQLNISYGAIAAYLKEAGVKNPSLKDISNAVIKIRQSKLPDPQVLGNSGSFFKNPVISKEKFLKLQESYPEIPHYELSEGEVKIPAGWLIDKAGLKGFRKGDAGVHKEQALVLVNYGNASGMEILNLAKEIQAKIRSKFNIDLKAEVNIF